MSFDNDLFNLLNNNLAPIKSYKVFIPQNSTYPAIAFNKVKTEKETDLSGQVFAVNYNIAFTIYVENPNQIFAVKEKLETILNDDFYYAEFQDEEEGFDPDLNKSFLTQIYQFTILI